MPTACAFSGDESTPAPPAAASKEKEAKEEKEAEAAEQAEEATGAKDTSVTANSGSGSGSASGSDSITTAAAAADTYVPGADPSVIKVGSTYHAVKTIGGGIAVRSAPTLAGLANVASKKVWTDPGIGDIWAPKLVKVGAKYYIYFTGGKSAAHRMYAISSDSPNTGYGTAQKIALPDDMWAIDGSVFRYNNQLWMVWSGWSKATNGSEQNLYIVKMSGPTTPTGPRYIISQPRESWERKVGKPYINEAPIPLKDPEGLLHIVYSANGSWSDQYCLGELRLRKGGNPTYIWDWYKSNGCLFGSNPATMMKGWPATSKVNGPGSNSFALLDGDINNSPPAGPRAPFVYHAVPKGTPYSWSARQWRNGTFVWWGNTTYTRANVPGATSNTGASLRFFE
ncbi:hydrolase [Streptomyces paludis]|uniref:Hydrolase n=2 Tax=Streptomyces paludis TaxID=2282738 RepID=A0A345HR67_9ACTN|nr:hydrolase [Streptomyces paludis]